MPELDPKIAELEARLDSLVRTQINFQHEISAISAELATLRGTALPAPPPPSSNRSYDQPALPKPEPPIRDASTRTRWPTGESSRNVVPPASGIKEEKTARDSARQTTDLSANQSAGDKVTAKSNLEKFIGENLLSKVGIVILILGVAIGAKYAVDQGWVSPAVRIAFGYFTGLALFGLAFLLRAKYEKFSAVLIGGSLAILYFVTYFAYALYGLFGQMPSFAMMAVVTCVAVASAIVYSRQVIAHIGLVGAYAVPFLLSDNSGKYSFLFTYIAIVNIGILALSLVKYWKPLFYTSFIVTWATFFLWYLDRYDSANHFGLAFTFALIYFLTFYITFLGYKFRSGQNAAVENVSLILANSFIFYGIGYALLVHQPGWAGYLGTFTILNAAVHLAFASAANRIKSVSADLVMLLGALVLTFITISVPVQLDGHYVTLAWAAEAALLFVIGRMKPIELYEYYSYPLLFLASVVLLKDFADHWWASDAVLSAATSFPFLSRFFVTSIFYVAAFFLIFFVNRNRKYDTPGSRDLRTIIAFVSAGAGTLVLYNAFRVQIGDYFDFLRFATTVRDDGVRGYKFTGARNGDLVYFNILSQIDYTMLFLAVVSAANLKWFKSVAGGFVSVLFELMSLFIFTTVGLYSLSELRRSYLKPGVDDLFRHGPINVGMRYISYVFAAMVFISIYRYIKSELLAEYSSAVMRRTFFEMLMSVSMFFLLSSELLNWMDIVGEKESFKLGLSIFWGLFSLALASLGIYFGRKHLRISAIVIFGITLIKLFIYDIEDLGTLGKTAVFVSLGVLMLIVSFLYHKYKGLIAESDAKAFAEKL